MPLSSRSRINLHLLSKPPLHPPSPNQHMTSMETHGDTRCVHQFQAVPFGMGCVLQRTQALKWDAVQIPKQNEEVHVLADMLAGLMLSQSATEYSKMFFL